MVEGLYAPGPEVRKPRPSVPAAAGPSAVTHTIPTAARSDIVEQASVAEDSLLVSDRERGVFGPCTLLIGSQASIR